jgi:hypothetical protein
MERQQILDLYTWEAGVCFRHPAKGEQPTALVQEVHPRTGPSEEVRACADCVVDLEQQRWLAACESGHAYRPGHAGEAPDQA